MSIRAVIGVGPRSGTSWVMHQLALADLPVYSTPGVDELMPTAGNPDGYYETDINDRPGLKDVIVKVWPGPDMNNADIERVLVLRRKRDRQLESMRVQLQREGYEEMSEDVPFTAEQVVDLSDEHLNNWLAYRKPDLMEVKTEDLDERMPEIIEFMRGGY